jgi:hypothetical protein
VYIAFPPLSFHFDNPKDIFENNLNKNLLKFRKYDVINLVSSDDDHCWVGELNGLVGWFPAKFVELIDERSKEYSQAGDDKVTQAITG